MNKPRFRLLSSLIFNLILVIFVQSLGAETMTGANLAREFDRLMNARDYLSARVLLKENWRTNLNRGQWKKIRRRMHHDPKIGWDIVRGWDTKSIAAKGSVAGLNIDAEIRRADKLFAQKQYAAAYEIYRTAASAIQKSAIFADNRFLYYDLVTSMSRSLYANKQYLQAYGYYLWIPPIYPKYKQILFERMWAAFRAGETEHALGDLIAQYSPYFGGIINPEAFLVQIYTYKKLCLDQDLNRVLLLVEKLRKRLEENGFSAQSWAAADLETLPLANLSEQTRFSSSKWVSEVSRGAEKTRLGEMLKRKYEFDRREYLSNLKKVGAYAKMAFDLSTKELPRVRELPKPDALIAQRLEMWPIDGPEDWLDEIGNKFFIGKSQCGAESKNAKLTKPTGPSLFEQEAVSAVF
jgi:hypothetical protein